MPPPSPHCALALAPATAVVPRLRSLPQPSPRRHSLTPASQGLSTGTRVPIFKNKRARVSLTLRLICGVLFEVFTTVFDIHFMEHYEYWTFKCTTYRKRVAFLKAIPRHPI